MPIIPQLAAIPYVAILKDMIPAVLCFFYCCAIENYLNRTERSVLSVWRPALCTLIIAISYVAWLAWTSMTPMASLIQYNNDQSSDLFFSIIGFGIVIFISILSFLYTAVRRMMKEVVQMKLWDNFLVFRFLEPAFAFAVTLFYFYRANTLVGEEGLFKLLFP